MHSKGVWGFSVGETLLGAVRVDSIVSGVGELHLTVTNILGFRYRGWDGAWHAHARTCTAAEARIQGTLAVPLEKVTA